MLMPRYNRLIMRNQIHKCVLDPLFSHLKRRTLQVLQPRPIQTALVVLSRFKNGLGKINSNELGSCGKTIIEYVD